MPLSDQGFEEFKNQRQSTVGLSDEGFEVFKAEKLKPKTPSEPFLQLKTSSPLVGAVSDLYQQAKALVSPEVKPKWQASSDLGFQTTPSATTSVSPEISTIRPESTIRALTPQEEQATPEYRQLHPIIKEENIPATTTQETVEKKWAGLQETLSPSENPVMNSVKGVIRAGLGIPVFVAQLGDLLQQQWMASSPWEGAKIVGRAGIESAQSLVRPIENMIYTIGYAISPFGSKTEDAEYKARLEELKQDPTAPIVSAYILKGLTKAPLEMKKTETFKKTVDAVQSIRDGGTPPIIEEPSAGKLQGAQSDLLQQTMRKAKQAELLAKEEPSIGKLQSAQSDLLQRIMEEAKKKVIEPPPITKAPPKEPPLGADLLKMKRELESKGVGKPAPTAVAGAPAEIGKPAGGIAPVMGTGETKVRGLAKHIEEKAIEGGLTEGFKGLPEYDVLNMKEQAQKTADFMSKDYESAKRIAMGYEPPPPDIHSSAFLVGVEQSALKTGDVATIRDLALNSKLMEEATSAGQWIRTLGERNPESPVGAIAKIAKAREETVRVRIKDFDQVKQKELAGIKTQIKKASLSGQTWEQFIQSIRC